jgi:hypothetical protein
MIKKEKFIELDNGYIKSPPKNSKKNFKNSKPGDTIFVYPNDQEKNIYSGGFMIGKIKLNPIENGFINLVIVENNTKHEFHYYIPLNHLHATKVKIKGDFLFLSYRTFKKYVKEKLEILLSIQNLL